MRIVAGEWRGRRIKAPPGQSVRPTGDRVREAWMSIVQPLIPDAHVLDLFAGTGALGIEALSRGAASAHFVERHPKTARLLTDNLATLGATDRATVSVADAVAFVEKMEEHSFDLAFADPPYATDAPIRLAALWLGRPFATVLGIEHASSLVLPAGGKTRRYGTTSITFYR